MNSKYYKSQIIKKIVTLVLCSVGIMAFTIVGSGGKFEFDGISELLQIIVTALMAGSFFYLPFFYGSNFGIRIIGRVISGVVLGGVSLMLLEKLPVFLNIIIVLAIPGVDIGVTVYKYKKAQNEESGRS